MYCDNIVVLVLATSECTIAWNEMTCVERENVFASIATSKD